MLIHHFGAETQGFQGLVDQNDRGKAWKKHFLWGGSGFLNFSERRLGISQCI